VADTLLTHPEDEAVKFLLALMTGPIVILAILLAIPVGLVFVALGGVTLVFLLWTLYWGAVWLAQADPDAPVRFFQAFGYTSLGATTTILLSWSVVFVKELAFPSRRLAVKQKALPPEPPQQLVLMPRPANDWKPSPHFHRG
jgi:hypothetical protein